MLTSRNLPLSGVTNKWDKNPTQLNYSLTQTERAAHVVISTCFSKTCFVFCFSPGMSPPRHSSSNETPRSMKGDPNQAKVPTPGPLGAAFPHSYEFHTKRKMFDKGPEVQ